MSPPVVRDLNLEEPRGELSVRSGPNVAGARQTPPAIGRDP